MEHFFPDKGDPDVWNHLYRLGQPDVAQFARGLGADAYDVHGPAELRAILPEVLKKANAEGRPQVVVAHINPKSIPPYYLPDYLSTPTPKPVRAVQ